MHNLIKTSSSKIFLATNGKVTVAVTSVFAYCSGRMPAQHKRVEPISGRLLKVLSYVMTVHGAARRAHQLDANSAGRQRPLARRRPSPTPPCGAKSSTLNHQEGAVLSDEQPASLKITVNALLSSAPSPILTSGGEEGRRTPPSFPKALFHSSRVEILCQSRRQSSETIRSSAGVHFLFPSQDGVGFAKKNPGGFYVFMS